MILQPILPGPVFVPLTETRESPFLRILKGAPGAADAGV
jgi:hypothetical protein